MHKAGRSCNIYVCRQNLQKKHTSARANLSCFTLARSDSSSALVCSRAREMFSTCEFMYVRHHMVCSNIYAKTATTMMCLVLPFIMLSLPCMCVCGWVCLFDCVCKHAIQRCPYHVCVNVCLCLRFCMQP